MRELSAIGAKWGWAIAGSILFHLVYFGAIASIPGSGGDVPEPAAEEAKAPPPATGGDGGGAAPKPGDRPAAKQGGAAKGARPAAKPAGGAAAKKPQQPQGAETAQKAPELIKYNVRKGDNFTRIAKAHGCEPAELARLNGKTLKAFASIRVGQTIMVPAPKPE